MTTITMTTITMITITYGPNGVAQQDSQDGRERGGELEEDQELLGPGRRPPVVACHRAVVRQRDLHDSCHFQREIIRLVVLHRGFHGGRGRPEPGQTLLR